MIPAHSGAAKFFALNSGFIRSPPEEDRALLGSQRHRSGPCL